MIFINLNSILKSSLPTQPFSRDPNQLKFSTLLIDQPTIYIDKIVGFPERFSLKIHRKHKYLNKILKMGIGFIKKNVVFSEILIFTDSSLVGNFATSATVSKTHSNLLKKFIGTNWQ